MELCFWTQPSDERDQTETDRYGMVWIQATTLAAFLGLAAAWDLRERRVPNRLIAAFAMAALALAVTSGGASSLCSAGAGFAVGLGLLLVPFAFGFVGAGDAKFFGVVGGFLGPRLAFYAFLFGTALGALAAILTLWGARTEHARADRSPQTGDGPARRNRRGTAQVAMVPYALPLGLGAVTAVALELVGWRLP